MLEHIPNLSVASLVSRTPFLNPPGQSERAPAGDRQHGGEHHKSSRSGAWEGYEKLKQALEGLATAKGVSQSRIGAVAKLAAHYSKVRRAGQVIRRTVR